jgi:Protein of unknown function (DUF4435)
VILRRSPFVIANEIRLKRSQYSGSFVVLEGSNDKLFYGRFFDATACKPVLAYGKENVYEVVRILDADNFRGALGVVDADFGVLDGISANSPNIIYGDCHDVEAMLIRSPALDHLLREFGSEQKIEAFRLRTKRDIRFTLLRAATPLAYLRWYSLKLNLALRFEDLQLSQFIDRDTLDVDFPRMITAVKNHSQRQDLDSENLEEGVLALQDANHDVWQLCNGQDLLGVLSIGLRSALGSRRAVTVGIEELMRSLRLAFSEADFVASTQYHHIRAWEELNRPFRVIV